MTLFPQPNPEVVTPHRRSNWTAEEAMHHASAAFAYVVEKGTPPQFGRPDADAVVAYLNLRRGGFRPHFAIHFFAIRGYQPHATQQQLINMMSEGKLCFTPHGRLAPLPYDGDDDDGR